MVKYMDENTTNHSKVGLILRGAAMGVAEVIPGVSGGTIAFITGIYQDLIKSVSSVDHTTVADLFRFRISKIWNEINGPFLLYLIIGMVIGVISGVFGVTKLLESSPEILWGFFFGLIVASIPLMFGQMKNRTMVHVIPFLICAIIAYMVTSISPAESSSNYLYIFFAGMIAISAFVLPGISGSFILLLMGLYTVIIPTIKSFLESPSNEEFIILTVFGLGCVAGLAVFSRIVSAAFKNYHDITIAAMTGFMFGSLNKIWPWRNPDILLDKDSGQYIEGESIQAYLNSATHDGFKIIRESNILPNGYHSDPITGYVIVAFILGLFIVGGMYFIQKGSRTQ
jgi:putative membrane protein